MSGTLVAPIKGNKPLMILLAGALLGNLPLFAEHLVNLWKQPQYQYFPIILAIIGWLLWTRSSWREEALDSQWSFTVGCGALFTALAMAAFATWIMSPWAATLSAVAAFGGILLILRKWLYVENSLGIWALSLLVLKPPMGFDTRLAFWLQGITARVSGALLDMLGVVNLIEGNTIVLQDRHLFVEEACSGIVSLMSIIACCAIIAVWQNRPAPHAILLTISGAIWACVLNIFRITIMAFVLDTFQLDLTEGWRHEALGLVLFAGTLGLSFCTDRFLLFFLTPIATAESQLYGKYAPEQATNPLTRLWNCTVEPGALFFKPPNLADPEDGETEVRVRPRVPQWMLALGVLFVAVGIGQGVRAATSKSAFDRVAPKDTVAQMTVESMPLDLSGFRRLSFETVNRNVRDVFGEMSHQWQYAGHGYPCLLSADFVFHEFHELTMCYEGIGWKIAGRRTFQRPGSEQVFVEAEFGKDTGEKLFLVFGSLDQAGRNVPPPDSSLQSGFLSRLQKGSNGYAGGVYQTQAMVQTTSELGGEERKKVREAYFDFYDRIAQTIVGGQK